MILFICFTVENRGK